SESLWHQGHRRRPASPGTFVGPANSGARRSADHRSGHEEPDGDQGVTPDQPGWNECHACRHLGTPAPLAETSGDSLIQDHDAALRRVARSESSKGVRLTRPSKTQGLPPKPLWAGLVSPAFGNVDANARHHGGRAETRFLSVMSSNEATTPDSVIPSGLKSGWELTEIHVNVPSGLWMPMTTSRPGWPVRSVIMGGCVSPGKGEPSSWMDCQRGSCGVRPIIWSADNPRMRSALALQATMCPSVSSNTMPSCMAAMTDR